MGKAFLYGRTLEKDIADRYAKLTVYSPIDGTVLVRSVDSSATFEAKTNVTDGVVFNRISPGYWDVTLVDVENIPIKRIKIDELDREITLGDVVATVDITYPAGSVCTIIDGDDIYNAPDTSGKWTCSVYNICDLIVSCVDGDLNTSSVINVTNHGETLHVTLKYFAATIGITYPVGSTCTISDGIRTYTAPDTSGIWECTVNYPGMWTVICSDGEHTDSEPVSIVSDGENKSVELSYFAATITITYTEGSVCSVSNDYKTYTAPDTSGSWTCIVPNSGTWVISVTDNDSSKSNTVTITEYGQNVDIRIMLFEAYIVTTYPEGSTCSCSNGLNIYTAPDTSGSYTFTILNPGEWVVSCQNDNIGLSANDTIDITSDGQTENVTLSYIVHLYNQGDQCEHLTGGWDYVNHVNMYDTSIYMIAPANGVSGVCTINEINKMGRSKLCINVVSGKVVICATDYPFSASVDSVYGFVNDAQQGVSELDISTMPSVFYVYVYAYYGNSGTFDKIWLE